jgi:peptidyl-prolyl cis-trans isomerase SurA
MLKPDVSNEPVPFQAQQRDRAILSAARSGRFGISPQTKNYLEMVHHRGAVFFGGFFSNHLLAESSATLSGCRLDPAKVVATMRASSMKFFRLIPVLALPLCCVPSSRAELADSILAIVNDTVITRAQLDLFTEPAVESLRRQFADQPDAFQSELTRTLNDSLEQLVERQLILHDFDSQGYKLPDSLVNQLVQERIRGRFGDRVTLMKTLQAEGMTYEKFRDQVRDQFIEDYMRRNKGGEQQIIVSPYQIENYYLAHQENFKVEDEIKLRMIVLNKTSPDDTNTLNLAREIQTKIKEGATFQEMAAVYSQASQQHQAGDWGWVERSVLRKELADAAFALPVGQVSDVIDTPESCYVMLVEDKHPAHVRSLREIRDDIEKTLRTQEQARIQKEWIDGLKKKNFIRYL